MYTYYADENHVESRDKDLYQLIIIAEEGPRVWNDQRNLYSETTYYSSNICLYFHYNNVVMSLYNIKNHDVQ